MEASPDLQPSSLKFRKMSANNKLGIQAPTRLPNDIINEIIERLPAISNFRFKCVSKEWLSLNVEALKLKSQTHTTSGIFYGTYEGDTCVKYVKTEKDQNDDSFIDGTLSFLPEHGYMRIHDSCNGLLLCECQDTLPIGNLDQTSCLYVCNPATRKWVEIPYICIKMAQLAILDFNPLVSVHFDIIIIMREFPLPPKNIKVFSSKTGEWSVSLVTLPLLSQHRFYFPELLYKGLVFATDLGGAEIIGFDTKEKLCSSIDLPGRSYMNSDLFLFGLYQFGGCLHYYCCTDNNEICIWKMESGSWLLKSCFSVPFPMERVEDIKFHPIKDDVVFLQFNDRLYSYNMKTTQSVELCSKILVHWCLYSPFYLDFWAMGGR